LVKKFLQTHPPITKAIRFFSHFICTTYIFQPFRCSLQLLSPQSRRLWLKIQPFIPKKIIITLFF
jgi:hypothetical protein